MKIGPKSSLRPFLHRALQLPFFGQFPPKLYQVTLLLARKVKLPKCQEIPIISAGGKKQFCCCPWWM